MRKFFSFSFRANRNAVLQRPRNGDIIHFNNKRKAINQCQPRARTFCREVPIHGSDNLQHNKTFQFQSFDKHLNFQFLCQSSDYCPPEQSVIRSTTWGRNDAARSDASAFVQIASKGKRDDGTCDDLQNVGSDSFSEFIELNGIIN